MRRRRHVLGDEHPGARHFAADRRALQDAEQQQQHRRQDADRVVGRQQAHQQRRHRHQQHAQREHALAADQVAEVGHDDAAQRARQVAGREDAEGLQLAQPVGNVVREEQLPDRRREEHEDDEVVELERAAEGGEAQGLVVAARQGAVGNGARRAARFVCLHGQDDRGSQLGVRGARRRTASRAAGRIGSRHGPRGFGIGNARGRRQTGRAILQDAARRHERAWGAGSRALTARKAAARERRAGRAASWRGCAGRGANAAATRAAAAIDSRRRPAWYRRDGRSIVTGRSPRLSCRRWCRPA